jgi:hypothetical protein
MLRRKEDDQGEAETRPRATTSARALSSWTVQSARRVQLAVRSSLRGSQKAIFENNLDTSENTFAGWGGEKTSSNANIDQAMTGLYSLSEAQRVVFTSNEDGGNNQLSAPLSHGNLSRLLAPSSSYVPQEDWDPLLDGGYRNTEEEGRSHALVQAASNYEASPDWQWALSLENRSFSINTEGGHDAESEHDDDCFGEFQSASDGARNEGSKALDKVVKVVTILTPTSSSHPASPSNDGGEEEHSPGSVATMSTVNTLGLTKRVDDLLGVDETGSAVSGVLSDELMSTPALLEEMETVLVRLAQEEQQFHHVPKEEEDADSEATPKSRGPAKRHPRYRTPSHPKLELSLVRQISMELPISDLTTLEGRWTRRRQLERLADSEVTSPQNLTDDSGLQDLAAVLADLPELYQLSLDHVDPGPMETMSSMVKVLNYLPWGCVQLDQEVGGAPIRNDLSLWDDFMVDQLSQLDSALETVQKRMAVSVNPVKLQSANSMVHECEQNLRLAKIYWDRSSQSLHAAVAEEPDGSFNGSGVMGNTNLLEWWQQKEDCVQLQDLLERMESVTAREQDIIRRIDTFDATNSRAQDEYEMVMRLGQELRNMLNGEMSRLDSLGELRDSRLTSILEERFWKRLQHLSQGSVVGLCRGRTFKVHEYESLAIAALGLYEACNERRVNDDGDSAVVELSSKFDQQTGWSKHIVEAISYELDRCFATALLEPVDADHSAYVKDLRSLEQEINCGWGDSAKLKTMTHNLVTIRFDFEIGSCYLPRVFQRLCEGLLEVLHAHFTFYKWHCQLSDEGGIGSGPNGKQACFSDPNAIAALQSIATGLAKERTLLWERCESILVHALEEYHHFSGKRKLFQSSGVGVDDSTWETELHGLHTVHCAIHRFLAFKTFFLEKEGSKCRVLSNENTSPIYEALQEIADFHLRQVHVEAMTSMGRMLSKESWYLVSFNNPEEPEKKGDPCVSAESVLSMSVLSALSRHKTFSSSYSLDAADTATFFDRHFMTVSPLLRNVRQPLHFVETASDDVASTMSVDLDKQIEQVYAGIKSLIDSTGDTRPRITTRSITDGLVEWIARLVMVSLKLPLVAEKAASALENIFDLYFTTVFRLCMGSHTNERIIFGEADTQPAYLDNASSPQSIQRKRPSSPPLIRSFGHERRNSGRPPAAPFRTSVSISSTLNAEICAPLQREIDATTKLRDFIDRAQQDLRGNVNLNRVDSWIGNPDSPGDPEEYACGVARSLERREAAAWSCLVVAGLAKVTYQILSRHLLSHSSPARPTAFPEQRLGDYAASAVDVVTLLTRKASEVSCTRALSPAEFVKEIVQVGAGWEESKLHEQPNDYVESLCERCCLIWGFVTASGKLPHHLASRVWERLQSASFLTLVEGFSRVNFCSTEGRALMALDLASASSYFRPDAVLERLECFDLSFASPRVTPRFGKEYVDMYVKVYYYPREDQMEWIANNYQSYRMDHVFALIRASSSNHGVDDFTDLIERVKSHYTNKL